MDIMGIYGNLSGQGPIFWAAASAVAGGITLLFVSLTIQARKTFSGRLRSFNPRILKKTTFLKKKSVHHPEINITDTGYGLSGKASLANETKPQPGVKTSVTADSKVMEGLLLRLRQAGDQLEELQNTVSSSNTADHNSVLKPHGDNVEYLIRTGIS